MVDEKQLGKREKNDKKLKQNNEDSDSLSLESKKDAARNQVLGKQSKRQRISFDFDLQEAFDGKRLEASMSAAIESKMKSSLL